MVTILEKWLSLRLLRLLAAVSLFLVEPLGKVSLFGVQRRYELSVPRRLLLFKFGGVEVFLRRHFLEFAVLLRLRALLVLGINFLVPRVLKWVVYVVLFGGWLVLRYGLAWILFHVSVGSWQLYTPLP